MKKINESHENMINECVAPSSGVILNEIRHIIIKHVKDFDPEERFRTLFQVMAWLTMHTVDSLFNDDAPIDVKYEMINDIKLLATKLLDFRENKRKETH